MRAKKAVTIALNATARVLIAFFKTRFELFKDRDFLLEPKTYAQLKDARGIYAHFINANISEVHIYNFTL